MDVKNQVYNKRYFDTTSKESYGTKPVIIYRKYLIQVILIRNRETYYERPELLVLLLKQRRSI